MRRRWLRVLLGLTAAAVVAWLSAVPALTAVGRFLVIREADFEQVDALVVLPGSVPDRVLEAVDLISEGKAKRILLLEGETLDPSGVLLDLGVKVPGDAEINRLVLSKKGVADSLVTTIPGRSGSSREDALLVRGYLASHPVRSIAVVTCKYHSYRARLNFRDCLRGVGVKLYVVPSRHCRFSAEGWWRDREQAKTVYLEVAKLAAFWLGYK